MILGEVVSTTYFQVNRSLSTIIKLKIPMEVKLKA